MTLCTFFKTKSWFNACLKFLMWMNYYFLLCKLATSFLTFLIFILSGKKGESLWGLFRFSGYWIWFPRKYPSSLSSFVVFYEIFIMKTICKQLRHPYKLFPSQYLRYDDSPFFIVIFPVCIVSFCISVNNMAYSTSITVFYH